MTLTTLVAGSDADARESAIVAALTADSSYATTALILEGAANLAAVSFDSSVHTIRIAPGCPCCTGKLTMQVTLNRILRRPPERLYIGLANAMHLDVFRNFLEQPPYAALLTLTEDIRLTDHLTTSA